MPRGSFLLGLSVWLCGLYVVLTLCNNFGAPFDSEGRGGKLSCFSPLGYKETNESDWEERKEKIFISCIGKGLKQ